MPSVPPTSKTSRQDLVIAAADLLATVGPKGLTTRALAKQVGASTMAVYTHFGGLPAVLHAVIAEGFARLEDHMRLARERANTDDPVAELRALAHAYRDNALTNPHLYAVMFGGEAALGQPLEREDYRVALTSLRTVAETAARARDAGQLADVDEWELARRLHAAVHGAVSLELGGYLGTQAMADATYEALVNAVLAGTAPPV